MSDSGDEPLAMRVPERLIPPPLSVSPQAQALLAAYAAAPAPPPYPALDDTAGWVALVAGIDAHIAAFGLGARLEESIASEAIDLGGAAGYLAYPKAIGRRTDRVILDIHGGGLIAGGGDLARLVALTAADAYDATVYGVDYRMPPHHVYPAALDDCMAAYRTLLAGHSADRIIVRGASAGGNLAAALALRARDEGLPLPAGLILATPEIDLTESGDSFATNIGVDGVLRRSLMPANLLYAAGHDLADPYLSPLFGDFAKGFPPTIFTTGTRDLFLSNCVRMHNGLRRVGVPSELLIVEAMPHGSFRGAPEEAEMAADLRRFADRLWNPAESFS